MDGHNWGESGGDVLNVTGCKGIMGSVVAGFVWWRGAEGGVTWG